MVATPSSSCDSNYAPESNASPSSSSESIIFLGETSSSSSSQILLTPMSSTVSERSGSMRKRKRTENESQTVFMTPDSSFRSEIQVAQLPKSKKQKILFDIPKAVFSRLVREISAEITGDNEPLKYSEEAMTILQGEAEDHITRMFFVINEMMFVQCQNILNIETFRAYLVAKYCKNML